MLASGAIRTQVYPAMPRNRVITEREIRRAIREHVAELDARAATITPSAIDLAHRAGIILVGLRGEQQKLRTQGKPTPASTPARPASRAAPDASAPASAAATVPSTTRRIAVGADHGGVALKDSIANALRKQGHSVVDHGTDGTDPVDYPDFAIAVARAVASGAADLGIMVDGAGIGSCMAANKIAGVRAALCYDVTTASNAREHNNANLLTLGGGLIGPRLALAIVDTFIDTPFGGGRHAARVAKIDALDRSS